MDRWLWGMLAGALALLVFGLVAVTVPVGRGDGGLQEPEAVARAYLADLSANRADLAWARLSPAAQSKMPRKDFEGDAASVFLAGQTMVLGDVTRDGSGVRVTYATHPLEPGPFAEGRDGFLVLQQAGGAWRLTSGDMPRSF